MLDAEVERLNLHYCALCHAPIDTKRLGQRDMN